MTGSDEMTYQPAAKKIWGLLQDEFKDNIAKNRRNSIAALRRLLMSLSYSPTCTPRSQLCPLEGMLIKHLNLPGLTNKDREAILDTWNWLLGIRG